MGYGEVYYHDYCINDTEDKARLSILRKDYSGVSNYVDAGTIPFRKTLLSNDDDLLGGIYPTKASIVIIGDENFGMDDLFTASDTEFQIIHYINDQIDWIGFLTPEGFGELDTNGVRYLEINAYDGLTKLKDLKFVDDEGKNYFAESVSVNESLLFAVKECLKKTGLQLDIFSLVDRVAIPVSRSNDLSMIVDILPGQTILRNSRLSEFGSLLAVGNYFQYRVEYEDSYRLTRIEEVFPEDPVNGYVAGIRVNPPFPVMASLIWGQIFAPTGNLNVDVLDQAKHNIRLWIDPSKSPEPKTKEDRQKKYYDYTDGTYTCWDVLEAIALALDFKVIQSRGKWILESLEAYRIDDEYFLYDYDGNQLGRHQRFELGNIPCEPTPTNYRHEGNTRYIDKTLRSASVAYSYRYKVDGDSISNKILNGSLTLPSGEYDPATVVPLGWERVQLRDRDGNFKPINYSIYKLAVSPTEIYTTQNFNQYNRLRSSVIVVNKGDKLDISWRQSLYESSTESGGTVFAVFLFELITTSGDVYHLVNSEEEEDWEIITDSYWHTSGKPKGRWVKVDKTFLHFNTSYSAGRYVGSGWGWSDMSNVELSAADVPEDGEVTINIVGVGSGLLTSASVGDREVRSYVVDYDRWIDEHKINYSEVSSNNMVRVIWGNSRIRIDNLSLGVLPSGSQGKGRRYEYLNNQEYYDSIDDVSIKIGDEINDNHISALIVDSRQNDTWTNRDGSLFVGSIGMLLSRSIMRRYYRPKRLIDGIVSIYPNRIDQIFNIGGYEGIWCIKSGDIDSVSHTISGTFTQLPDDVLPYGGIDYGENSLSDSSSGGGSSSSGSGGGVIPIVSPSQDLQDVTDKGKYTDNDIVTKGTRNSYLLAIPGQSVDESDEIEGEHYLHTENGYLYVDGEKSKSGHADTSDNAANAQHSATSSDSEKWDGKTYSDTFDQGLKKEDIVEFGGLSISGDAGLSKTIEYMRPDSSIWVMTFKSGILISDEEFEE